jgi:uncharacterized protein YdhG (YjbR/CyaY superfamily)
MTTAATVAGYLAALPEERRAVVAAVRDAVRRRMPDGYEEALAWGAITWQVPLARYPDTYNEQPLCYVSLAAQKRHYALYLMCVYMNPELERRLRDGFARAGLKLDMGKSCVRFKRLEDVALDVVCDLIAATTPDEYIARYERSRAGTTKAGRAKAGGAKAGGAKAGRRGAPESPAAPGP